MAIKFSASGKVNLDVDTLFNKMTDPVVQQKMALEFGSLKAECSANVSADGKVIVELYTEDPDKKSGGIKKARLSFKWDKASKVCNWSRADLDMGDTVRVEGVSRLTAAGAGATTYSDQGEIDIKIPIMGNMIAKKIAEAMERKFPDKCEFWSTKA